MQQPLVSVIMGVFNQRDEAMLKDAVNSILNQTYQNIEFIIWDDGSDKDAAELILRISELDSRIRVAGREGNKGLAYSLNECIALANGSYIARMDADDISKPMRIACQVEFLENHPEYAWCGTSADLFDEEGCWGIRIMPEIPKQHDYFKYSPYIHPSVMFRAELFDENNKYLSTEETFRCEDYEIFMNLVARGLKGYNLKERLFSYRETRQSYKKRKTRYRIDEAKIRYRNYKKMGLLFPFGWVYVLRPIAAILIPSCVLTLLKRGAGIHSKKKEEKMEEGQRENTGLSGKARQLQKKPEK